MFGHVVAHLIDCITLRVRAKQCSVGSFGTQQPLIFVVDEIEFFHGYCPIRLVEKLNAIESRTFFFVWPFAKA